MNNRVALFTSGMADFRFVYPVAREGTQIEIPVPTRYLADGINLAVYSADHRPITVEPRQFSPKPTESKVKIDADNVLASICTTFRGAKLNISKTDGKTAQGILLGLDVEKVTSGLVTSEHRFISLYAKGGVQRIALNAVSEYRFEEEAIQSTVERLLQQHFSQIRPDSSLVTVRVRAGEEGAKAVVGWTMPTAAWTPAYQLRKMGDVWRLTGSAIVHNNTDQPWNDCELLCITGIPYAIETDLAEQRVPKRNRVNFVTDQAAGGTQAPRGRSKAVPAAARMMTAELESVGGLESASRNITTDGPMPTPAQTLGATAAEIADFCVLSPKELVTIRANSSAAVDVIGTDLRHCREELYYNYHQDQMMGGTGRPEMALRFKNPLPHSLQRGPCNVYLQLPTGKDFFAGTGDFPAMQSGEERILLHGQDTAVEVTRAGGSPKEKITAVQIAKGVLYTETTHKAPTTYTIHSAKPETCEIVIDHPRALAGYGEEDTTISSDAKAEEETASSVRYRLKVASGATVKLEIMESRIVRNRLDFGQTVGWFRQHFIEMEHPSVKVAKGLTDAMAIQKEIDGITLKINGEKHEETRLREHQKEIRQNLSALADQSPHRADFENQMAETDRNLQASRSRIIALMKQNDEAEVRLQAALQKVTIAWSDHGGES